MYNKIISDVEEVQQRLQAAGVTNIDINNIFHLLEEFGPGCDMDFVTNLFMVSNESKKTSNAAVVKTEEQVKGNSPGPAKTDMPSGTIVIDLTLNSQSDSNLQEDSADVLEDSDVDESNYYENDDIFDMEEQKKLPPPLLPSICLLGNAEEPLVRVEESMENNNGNAMEENNAEIFEENNNDPNNNMDSIESSVPNQNNNNKHFEPATVREYTNGIIDRSISPKPGCSKDISSDDFSSSDETTESRGPYWLVQMTKKILDLMPYLKFENVYKTLRNNKEFDDCIEVTLWEILAKGTPNKTPNKKSKRKSLEVPKDVDKKRMRPAESNSESLKKEVSTKDLFNDQNQRRGNDGTVVREMPLVDQFPKKNASSYFPDEPNKKQFPNENAWKYFPDKRNKQQFRNENAWKYFPDESNKQQFPNENASKYFRDEPNKQQFPNENASKYFPDEPNKQQIWKSNSRFNRSKDSGEAEKSVTDIKVKVEINTDSPSMQASETDPTSSDSDSDLEDGKRPYVRAKSNDPYPHYFLNGVVSSKSACHNVLQAPKLVIPEDTFKTGGAPQKMNSGAIKKVILAPSKLKHLPAHKSSNRETKTATVTSNSFEYNTGVKIKQEVVEEQNVFNEPDMKPNEDVKSIPEFLNLMASKLKDDDYTQPIENSHFQEHYYILRGIFPNVDRQFIMSTCKTIKGSSPENTLHLSIEHLLIHGKTHPNTEEEKKITVEEPPLNFKEQYKNLLDIFPNADPNYLRNFVQDNYNNPNAIKEFVQSKLETHDYPTKAEFLKNQRLTEQQKQYTVDFNIEKFLEIIPDPVAYFENPKRKQAYNPIVFEFLKNRYHRIRIVTISHWYRTSKYHFTLTAKKLDDIKSDMQSKRYSYEVPTLDIPILQEMAYVKHRKEIKAHLKEKRMKEEREFQEMKAKNMLWECQCCFNDECVPSKCSECEAGHIFCNSCIKKGIESKMSDGETHIKCFTECSSEFSLTVLQKVLPPTQFSILLKKRQEAEVMAAGLEGLVFCPFCPFASIPPPEDKVFKCLNPDCMKESCRLCKELNHVPLKCGEVTKADKARLLLEEKMTQALLRTCYSCKKQFFKEEGCNKMVCVCGAMMCYICDSPVKDYSHFSGQGSQKSNLCPLWSDNRHMNAITVRKVAEEVKREIEAKNPELRIDTAKLLPVVPPKTKGPHDDIPFADVLPPYVQRILRPQ